MNCLSVRKRAEILSMLCEGCSIASTSRHTGAAENTIARLLCEVGATAAIFLDDAVRKLKCRRVQADEIWSYCAMREKRVPDVLKGTPGLGDTWLWLAIDTESKLILSWHVGCRGTVSAVAFIKDLASRLVDRIQISTDGHRPYIVAIEKAFCSDSVDYAMIAKRAIVTEADLADSGMVGHPVFGEPDPLHINTSYIERYNLTVRMTDRRFTRKTNAFSKLLANHRHSVALHVLYYNFVREHMAIETTPAIKAKLTNRRWYYEDIVELVDRRKRAEAKPSGVTRITR